jgi:hypothetical protein
MDPFPGFMEDPLGLHKYLYVQADPVNFVDPLGLAEAVERSLLSRIWTQVISALKRLARAIACIFLRAASWLASMVSFIAWLVVRTIAAAMGLAECVCTPQGYPPIGGTLKDWLRAAPDILQDAMDWYNNHPEWQGMDPDRTPVRYRPKDEVNKIRKMPGESGGHHPHPLGLGGPPGQVLTPTGETRRWKNPTHTKMTNLGNKIRDNILSFCTNKKIPIRI